MSKIVLMIMIMQVSLVDMLILFSSCTSVHFVHVFCQWKIVVVVVVVELVV